MAPQDLKANEQIVRGVPLPAVEAEIRRLRRAALGINRERWIMTRVSTVELVVYLEDGQTAAAVCALVDHLAQRHPLRAILLVAEPTASGSITADIHVACQPSSTGGQHVFCEKIIVPMHGHAGPLTSVLLPLLQYDVPTFLWWIAALQPASPILRDLITIADRLILDIVQPGPAQNDLVDLARLLQEQPRLVPSCTAWARLAPWRHLTAALFDTPTSAPYLWAIQQVQVDYTFVGGRTGLPVLPALFLGWLTSQLGWQPGQITADPSEGAWQSQFWGRGRPLRVSLNGRIGGSGEFGEIRAITFTASGPAGEARFALAPADDPDVYCLTRQIAGGREITCDVVAPTPTPEQVLLNELARLERDVSFEQALAATARLLRRGTTGR